MLVYLISVFCGVLLTILVLAFVSMPKFRRDCLAKQGEVEILKYFSVHGAVVLCLFGLFVFGLVYPLSYAPEMAENQTLKQTVEGQKTAIRKLEDQIATLKKKAEKRSWEVKIPLVKPPQAPEGFRLRDGLITVQPSNFHLGKPECRENNGVCVFSLRMETEADQTFEEGVNLITYDNGIYFAQINPKEILKDYNAGRTNAFTQKPDERLRLYGQISILDPSNPQHVYPSKPEGE